MKNKFKQILCTIFLSLGLLSNSMAQVENNLEEIKKAVDKIFINQPLWSINSSIY